MTSTPRTYERLTVNLIERAAKALALAAQTTGDSKTDTVNRALQLYAYLMTEKAQGNEILLRSPSGEIFLIKII